MLHTSQPGVSKQVRLLEELGITVFERNGKRLTGVTEPAKAVLEISQRILRGRTTSGASARSMPMRTPAASTSPPPHPGALRLAHRRQPLSRALAAGAPDAASGQPDADRRMDPLRRGRSGDRHRVARPVSGADHAALPSVGHAVIAPAGHPLLDDKSLSLAALAKWPLVTYDPAFSAARESTAP